MGFQIFLLKILEYSIKETVIVDTGGEEERVL